MMISIESAKTLAIDAANDLYGPHMNLEAINISFDTFFEKEYVSSEYCWIFLRKQAISIPDSAWFSKGSAITVSYLGEVRYIADHQNDVKKLEEYATFLSKHFKANESLTDAHIALIASSQNSQFSAQT